MMIFKAKKSHIFQDFDPPLLVSAGIPAVEDFSTVGNGRFDSHSATKRLLGLNVFSNYQSMDIHLISDCGSFISCIRRMI